LPNATGNDLTLRSGGNANPNVAILNGSLTVTGTITGDIDATNIKSGVLAFDRIPNLSADKITAGTTTGNLTIGGNLRVTGSLTAGNKITVPGNQKIEFTDADDSDNLKLQLWSGYGLGINPNTLFYAAYSKHSWRDLNGANERMMLTTGADGSLTVKGTGTSSFAGNLTIGRNLTVRSMSTLESSLNVNGQCDFLDNVNIGTALQSKTLQVNGNLRVNGTITLGIIYNSVTMSFDKTGLTLTMVNSFGQNKKIKWDGDNNWVQVQ
jgi:hypothetical protein